MSGNEYGLRELGSSDAAGLAEAYTRNRDHLAPWEPLRPDAFFTAAGQEDAIARRLDDIAGGRGVSWVVVGRDGIVGCINLNNVVRSVFQSCSLGYWIAAEHTGRGVASMAVERACEHARGMGLHRVEAGTIVTNTASQRVLAKCGFTQFGTAPDYLFIAGRWQDHRLFQRLLHSEPPVLPS